MASNSSTDSTLDEILAFQAKPSGCGVPRVLEGLTDSERNAVLTAFADPDVQATAIARWMTSKGWKIGGHTIQRHRRGSCGCVRG